MYYVEQRQLARLTINTALELNFQTTGVDYWTSGEYSNNRWEWASTEPFQPMTYTNWYTGEPSNSQIGSFAYINFNFGNKGFWFDEVGSAYFLFICESIDGSTATTAGTTTSTSMETTRPITTTPRTTTPFPTCPRFTCYYPQTTKALRVRSN